MNAINPKTGKAIAVAMKSPEANVHVPAARRNSSFSAVVEDLPIGGSCARVLDVTSAYVANELCHNELLAEARERMRNNLAPSIAAARQRTNGTYNQEVAQVVMPTGRLFIISIVTRTA